MSTIHLEPDLQELIEDPIVRMLMERDGVELERLVPQLKETSLRISQSQAFEKTA